MKGATVHAGGLRERHHDNAAASAQPVPLLLPAVPVPCGELTASAITLSPVVLLFVLQQRWLAGRCEVRSRSSWQPATNEHDWMSAKMTLNRLQVMVQESDLLLNESC